MTCKSIFNEILDLPIRCEIYKTENFFKAFLIYKNDRIVYLYCGKDYEKLIKYMQLHYRDKHSFLNMNYPDNNFIYYKRISNPIKVIEL